MKNIIIYLFCFLPLLSFSQHKKIRGPIWLTHDKDTNIIGTSLSFYPNLSTNNSSTTNTYGMRLEVFPFSFLYFLVPNNPISRNEKEFNSKFENNDVTQKIYGLNISTGTFENIDSHGLSITGIMHYSRKNNGIAIAGLTNSIEKANGLIIGLGGNGIYEGNGIMIASVWGNGANKFNGIQISADNHIHQKGRGIQIGLYNEAVNFKGLQLGLWNKNQKRSLPIINWNF